MKSNGPESGSRILFVTGRLAEFALRQVVDDLGRSTDLSAEIAVLPITVAALMTPQWIARHLQIPPNVDRVVLPGYCRGDLAPILQLAGNIPVERGPDDLRDLPRHFGQSDSAREGYGGYDIEIVAEINHAPRLSRESLIASAKALTRDGADVIDLGCEPGHTWSGVADAVKALRDLGVRVSIDSFDPAEVSWAVQAGAELVLSVNSSNREHAADWGAEVVVIPDLPGTLDGLDETVRHLEAQGVPYRLDPIIEPIGFGFAASLGRYLDVRARYPEAAMMMGIGNLTELTDADSAGLNTLLIGFCQEQKIRSVLTTQVIHWARSCVREIDVARRLMYHAVHRRMLPKHLDPRLIMLRDPRVERFGPENLAELQRRIRDHNWRIFAEDGQIHAINNAHFLSDADPFVLFDQMNVTDASHAFYLGYEMMKAKTALTLGKAYRQDQALEWGFLTEPEVSHKARRREALAKGSPTHATATRTNDLDQSESPTPGGNGEDGPT